MKRIAFPFFVALGLILASALIPTANAQPYPSSCTPTCNAGCHYCISGTPAVHTMQWTFCPSSNNCTGACTSENQLPDAVLGNTLPANPSMAGSSVQWNPATSCPGNQVCMSNGTCCTPTTCTAPMCESTAGTDNCGNPCTATAEPCFCSMGASYIVAPTKDSMWPADTLSFGANCPHDCVIDTSYQTASWCSATTGTIEAVTDNESGCGSSGTPSTTCNPIFSLGCQSACSACSVECTPTACPNLSCSVTIGNCGQTCPITCDDEEHYCNGSRCVYVPPPPECFVAGTKVLLANGKETPIERLKAGDILLGSEGAHNKVVKLKIDPKKDWTIYAFNGGRYFVTKNHVFSTTAGWASINPESALRENPQLKIRKLKIGDVLITLQGSMRIEKITSKTAKDSVVYSPELDGNHEYYADGFLVHNSQIITQP